MKILHYALGFPPYRTGGLTKYCTDLMLTQAEQGHEVALLWPGKITKFNGKTKICKRGKWKTVESFELINPLPVSLDEGILNIDAYTKSSEETIYLNYLKSYAPDVVHIHTFMGLYKEFLQVTKQLGIRTVFTTHDYFGICPKVTLYHDGDVCDNDHGCADCVRCNQSALSLKKIIVLQSPIYRKLKNTKIVKILRRQHRKNFFEDSILATDTIKANRNRPQDYKRLRQYYISMLEMLDFIHFNSSVAEMVYRRYFQPKNSVVISITHRDIKDHRQFKGFDHNALRITYLGPAKPFKGFQFLIGILDEIWNQEPNTFELHIYSETNVERDYITHRQNGYPYSQLKEIFDNTDLLIVPSQWYETFGFTVLETLSFGLPVLVSDKVGAKNLIQPYMPYMVAEENKKIKEMVIKIIGDRRILNQCSQKIAQINIKSISEHSMEIIELYKDRNIYGKVDGLYSCI